MINNIAWIAFFLIIPLATPLSFNYTNFPSNDRNITFNGSANVAEGVIQLVREQRGVPGSVFQNNTGQATYSQPLNLWDRASRNITDFSTKFIFSINSDDPESYADGMAFFLAPFGSGIQEFGASLGLWDDNSNSTDNPFVAIEFDIYKNDWDPLNEHVGIDISSMISVANQTWRNASDSIMRGGLLEARVAFDSISRNLSLDFYGFSYGTIFSNHSSDTPSYIQSVYYILRNLTDILPENVTFGFSAATGASFAQFRIYSWSFSSNLELVVNGINSGTALPPVPGSSNSINANTGLVIVLAIGGSVLALVLGFIIYLFHKKRREKLNEVDEEFDVELVDEFEEGAGPKKFSYNELASATSKFAEQEKLGEGGFGGVYKGFLSDINLYVAVKRVSKGSSQGVKEYASEVKIISRLRHKNLVKLIGWCHQKQELLLVYEFMPNGSLDHHLFKRKSLLDWGTRLKIAHGLASALSYLHEDWEQCVVHRDIKSSNVMLDRNFNAKLGDFGLARLVDHEKGSQTTVLAGTMGYMAPECMITGKASKETDVFSFGVVVLEIASGRKPINPKAEQGQIHLVEWVWRLYGLGKILDVADPQLGDEFDSQEMKQLMGVGLWCAHPISALRPSIKQAIRVLNFEAPLPELPARMPVPMYCIPSTGMPLTPYGTILSGSNDTFYDGNTWSSKFTASSQESTSSASALLRSIN